MRLTLLLGLLVILAGFAATPGAAADHPCSRATTVSAPAAAVVGAYHEDCVGVATGLYGPDCTQALWGYHGSAAGVGGHHGCEAFAYVAAPGLAVHPVGSAHDPCDAPTPLATVPTTPAGDARTVGVYDGDCVGVDSRVHADFCTTEWWGHQTPAWGVGGSNGCHARAYVAPAGVPGLLP